MGDVMLLSKEFVELCDRNEQTKALPEKISSAHAFLSGLEKDVIIVPENVNHLVGMLLYTSAYKCNFLLDSIVQSIKFNNGPSLGILTRALLEHTAHAKFYTLKTVEYLNQKDNEKLAELLKWYSFGTRKPNDSPEEIERQIEEAKKYGYIVTEEEKEKLLTHNKKYDLMKSNPFLEEKATIRNIIEFISDKADERKLLKKYDELCEITHPNADTNRVFFHPRRFISNVGKEANMGWACVYAMEKGNNLNNYINYVSYPIEFSCDVINNELKMLSTIEQHYPNKQGPFLISKK